MCEAALRANRESRKQSAKLRFLVAAHREHDAAEMAAAKKPEDSEMSETLRQTREVLDRAREDLRR
jgi:hypothetical protein